MRRWKVCVVLLMLSCILYLVSYKLLSKAKNSFIAPGTLETMNNSLWKAELFTMWSTNIRSDTATVSSSTVSWGNGNWMEEREVVYERRRGRIQEVCRRNRIPRVDSIHELHKMKLKKDSIYEYVNRKHFAVNTDNEIMGCILNKVASSSLMTAFLKLIHVGEEDSSPHKYREKVAPKSEEDFQYINKTYLKFMFVRDPFERLLSCYLDKIIKTTHPSMNHFRKEIITVAYKAKEKRAQRNNKVTAEDVQQADATETFERRGKLQQINQYSSARAELAQKVNADQEISIENFTDSHFNNVSVVQGYRMSSVSTSVTTIETQQRYDSNSFTEPDIVNEDTTRTSILPTFEDFLEYILYTNFQGDGYESHWASYWRWCTPCHISYDIVGKLEDGEADFQYLWEKGGLVGKIPIPWKHKIAKLEDTKRLLKHYYSQVSFDTIQRTYRKYALDFEMFGYSIYNVLQLIGYSAAQNISFLHEPIKEQ